MFESGAFKRLKFPNENSQFVVYLVDSLIFFAVFFCEIVKFRSFEISKYHFDVVVVVETLTAILFVVR